MTIPGITPGIIPGISPGISPGTIPGTIPGIIPGIVPDIVPRTLRILQSTHNLHNLTVKPDRFDMKRLNFP